MSDLISRQAAIDAMFANMPGLIFNDVLRILRTLPSAQPERKRGRWTDDNACQFCGFQPWYERDIHTLSFCPNCGADMRGETDD